MISMAPIAGNLLPQQPQYENRLVMRYRDTKAGRALRMRVRKAAPAGHAGLGDAQIRSEARGPLLGGDRARPPGGAVKKPPKYLPAGPALTHRVTPPDAPHAYYLLWEAAEGEPTTAVEDPATMGPARAKELRAKGAHLLHRQHRRAMYRSHKQPWPAGGGA